MATLLQRANSDYLYWDRFRRLPRPKGITAETAWAFVRLNRSAQMKQLPVADIHNRFFGYCLPDLVLEQLHFIDQNAAGQIVADDPGLHSAEKERYLVNSVMEEAIASSQIEGAATTRKVAKAMLRSGRKP